MESAFNDESSKHGDRLLKPMDHRLNWVFNINSILSQQPPFIGEGKFLPNKKGGLYR